VKQILLRLDCTQVHNRHTRFITEFITSERSGCMKNLMKVIKGSN